MPREMLLAPLPLPGGRRRLLLAFAEISLSKPGLSTQLGRCQAPISEASSEPRSLAEPRGLLAARRAAAQQGVASRRWM